MSGNFERRMDDADWDAVFQRQVARGDVVDDMGDLLGLAAGDSVVELGSGPGYTALRLAERVAPGPVYAVDRHPAALRYLRRGAAGRGIENVHPVVSDAEALALRFDVPVHVLAAFVLHHVDAPAAVIAAAYEAVPAGSTLLAVEYHPDSPGEVGPPPDRRIAPTRVRTWLADAGFDAGEAVELPEEKYAAPARKG